MPKLQVVETTYLKPSTEQAIKIEASKLIKVTKGDTIELADAVLQGLHYKLELQIEQQGSSIWYAFKDHVAVLGQDRVNLAVPHHSQLNNVNRPHGTCNVTSVAMCMNFYGIKPKSSGKQLEDELFELVERKGWDRHVHDHLTKVFECYGVRSRFGTEVSWDKVKAHLAGGNPVIVSGQFTRSGHIIVLRGYDDKGFFVNDPYGEYFASGYNRSKSGENLHYSYALMNRVSYGGSKTTWAHLPMGKV